MVEGLAAVADVDDLMTRLAQGLVEGTGAGAPFPPACAEPPAASSAATAGPSPSPTAARSG